MNELEIRQFIINLINSLIDRNNVKISKINLNKKFSQLGMDSLQMASFEYNVINQFTNLKSLPGFSFQFNTPEKIIQQILLLKSNQSTTLTFNKSFLKSYDLTEIPLSRAQQRIWFICRRDKLNNQNFIITFNIRLLDIEQIARFLKALNSVIMANSILRTSFNAFGTRQIIHSGSECYFSLLKNNNLENFLLVDVCSGEIPLRFQITKDLIFKANFHQILVDASSIRLFIYNLIEAFDDFEKYIAKSLQNNKEKNYFHYSFQEQNLMINENWKKKIQEEINFWLKKLSGWENRPIIPLTKLTRSPILIKSSRNIINLTIDANIINQIRKAAKISESTFFVICVSILRILIYKLFGIKDLWLGIPVENRHLENQNYEDTIGLFFNLSVFREILDSFKTFQEFVFQNNQGIQKVLKASNVPFDNLYGALHKNCNKNEKIKEDLFQIVVIQDFLIDIDNFSSSLKIDKKSLNATIEREKYQIIGASVPYPIMWHFIENKKTTELTLNVEYDQKIICENKVNMLVERYLTLCKNLADLNNPKVPLTNLHLRSKADLANFKENIQNNFKEFPNVSINTIIMEQLKKIPEDKIVIEDFWGKISSNEFFKIVNKFAFVLEQEVFKLNGLINISDDIPVILLLERNIDLIIVIISLWLIGRSVLPISNDWPKKKIQSVLNFLPKGSILITDKKDISFWSKNCLIFLKSFKEKVNNTKKLENFCFKYKRGSLKDILYFTFTSGSSGTPKIVTTEAIGLVNLIFNYTTLFKVSSNSIIYQVVNYAFDIFFADILTSLMNGAKLLLAKDMIPKMDELKQLTHAYIMPSYLTQLKSPEELAILAKIQVIQYGGETISKSWLEKAVKARINLFQLFGFTEHSVYTTYQNFSEKTIKSKKDFNKRMEIGKPFKNLYIYVVDEDEQLLTAIGAEGNLRSGGVGVARGYLDKNQNTAKNFQLDSWLYWSNKQSKFFQSGDYVEVLENGSMKFLGRKDNLVKINGNMVKLMELKLILEEFPEIQQAEVIIKQINEDKKNLLLAFISLNNNSANFNLKNIIDYIRDKLCSLIVPHMMPDKFLIVEKFYFNSNGKIDSKWLNDYIINNNEAENNQKYNFKAINNNQEYLEGMKVCQIFAKTFEINTLFPEENIFQKGADSLKILLAIQRVYEELNIEIDLNVVFRKKTVEKILKCSRKVSKSLKMSAEFNKIANNNYNIPLSYNQEHLWLLSKYILNPKSDAYIIPLKIKFNKKPNIIKLKSTLNRIIQENAVLRTYIYYNEEMIEIPLQIVLSGTESYVQIIDQEKRINLNEFILSEEIPIKINYFNNYIKIIFHHIAVDGESLKIISNRFLNLYNENTKITKSQNTYDYMYFAQKQRSLSFEDSLNYWQSELESVKNLNISFLKNIVPSTEYTMPCKGCYKFVFALRKENLICFSTNYSCPIFYAFLAAYLLHIYNEYKIKDIVIGIPFANRQINTANLVGYFVNVHAIRFILDEIVTKSITNFIFYISKQMIKAIENSDVPFELVIKKVKPQRKLNTTPLFQQMFNFEELTLEENLIKFQEEGLVAKVKEGKRHNNKFQQDWRVKSFATSAHIEIEYDSSLFVEQNIIKKVDNYVRILNDLLNDKLILPNLSLVIPKKIKLEIPVKFIKLEELELKIQKIWEEVLLIDQIGLHDNFFEIGGHSLLAARISYLIEYYVKIKCDISIIFQYQTIHEMGNFLYNLNFHNETLSASLSPEVINEKTSLIGPSSYIQTQILNIYKNKGSKNLTQAYTIQIDVKLSDKILENRLKKCLIYILNKQSALRTFFKYNSEGVFLQESLSLEDPSVLKNIFELWNPNTNEKLVKNVEFNPFLNPPLKIQLTKQKILRINLSHLIFDGTSMNIFTNDLINLYYSKNYSEKILVPKKNYIQFSEEFNQKCDLNKDVNHKFWNKILKTIINNDYNGLIKDRNLSLFTNHSDELNYEFLDLNSKISNICKHFNVTQNCLLLYSLGRVLQQRMTNYNNDFCIGIVKDMRMNVSLLNTIGFFVNTLAIPFKVNSGKSIKSSLTELNELLNEISNKYSYIPYDEILKITKKDLLFDAMLVIDNSSKNKLKNLEENHEFQILNNQNSKSKFPITFFFSYNENNISIRIEYFKEIFYKETIDVFINEWINLIDRLVYKDCDIPNNIIFEESNEFKKVEYSEIPQEKDIFQIIWEQAQKCPDSIAIQTASDQNDITYLMLIQIVDRLANEIRNTYFCKIGESIKADTLIALFGHRDSVEIVLILLAILKSGAAYLPIDEENTPKERIETIIDESKVRFCISTNVFNCNIAYDTIYRYKNIVKFERKNKNSSMLVNWKNTYINKAEDLSYVIFTSGSTGRPKGVAIQRIGLINMITGATRLFMAKHNNCIYQFTNFCFDNSVLEIFLALFNGMRIFIDEKKVLQQYFSIDRFCKHIFQYNITHAFFFSGLVESFEEHQFKCLAKLHYWIAGAEKLSKNLLEKALKSNIRVIQNYGPTECCCYVLSKHMKLGDNAQNLGKPIINTRLTLRTIKGDIAIPLTPHKLYISGIGLMRGYLNKTQENQPFVYFDEIKYYDTGDIVKRLPNGEIIFVERADSQVKIRGYRVETSEIESVIRNLHEIKLTKVILSEETKELIAYIVLKKNKLQIKNDVLRELCQKKMPYYMIPKHFIFLDVLPLTANAKLDVKKLPKLGQKKSLINCSKLSEDTQKLMKIISNIMNIKDLNLNDEFIYIGGNSLNAQRIINEIQNEYETEIEFNLFDLLKPNVTIGNFIKNILKNKENFRNAKNRENLKINIEKIPLSNQQEQMLYLSYVDIKGYYNLPFIQKFNSHLNISYLHQAFMEVTQIQGILRTRIKEETKSYELFQEQLSLTEAYIYLPKNNDIKCLNSCREIPSKLRKICAEKFEFFESPPVKCKIFKITETCEYILILLMHHILSDGKSTKIIEREISERYNRIKSKQQVFFDTPKNHSKSLYAKWSIEQKVYLSSESFNAKLLKLKQRLSLFLLNKINLEHLYSLNINTNQYTNNLSYFEIPIEKINSIEYTPYTFFTAVILKNIFKIWQQKQKDLSNMSKNYLLIGSPFNSRPNSATNIVGNFLNNIILAFPMNKIQGFVSIYEYLKCVSDEIQDAIEYSSIPFSKIIDTLREFNNEKFLFDISINCRYDLENDSYINRLTETVKDRNFAQDILEEAVPNRQINLIEIDVDQYSEDYRIRFRIPRKLKYFISDFQQICQEWLKIIPLKIPEKVCQAVKEIIPENLPEILSMDDNFFFLGGNSLLLLKLHRKLNNEFSVNLDLIDFINHPTIAMFIANIECHITKKLTNLNLIQTPKKENLKAKLDNFKEIVELATIEEAPEAIINTENIIVNKFENIVQVIYEKTPNLLPNLIIVFFHSLIGGNLCYSQLINSLKAKHSSMLILGIQHPETFKKHENAEFNFNTFKELIDYYSNCLENYFNKHVRFEDDKIVFIGASLGALLAYECSINLKDFKPKIQVIVSIDGNASDQTNLQITEAEHDQQMLQVINKITFGNLNLSIQEQMLQNSWKLLRLRLKHNFTRLDMKNELPKLILLKIKDDKDLNSNSYGWDKLGFNDYLTIEILGNHFTMLNNENSNNLADIILQNCIFEK